MPEHAVRASDGLRVCYEGGARVSFLEVRAGNAPAIHLYEKAGYHTEGVRKKYYQDNHEDALLMNLDPDDYENLNIIRSDQSLSRDRLFATP